MKFTSVSIAVISDGNNPLLLSPAFLGRNGIVPDDWKAKDVLVLPPLARVLYENGVEFQLEVEKVLIRATDPSQMDWMAELPRMTIAFLATLPQVAYRAVGLNFELREPVPGSEDDRARLLDGMMAKGAWMEFGEACQVEGTRLQYLLPEAILLILSIDRVQVPGDERSSEEIKFDANFHHDFEPNQDTERRTYINTLAERHRQLTGLLERFPVTQS